MLRTKTIAILSATLALFLGVLVSPSASGQNMALGGHGEIYRLLIGSKSELFPSWKGEDTPILALDISHQDGSRTRLLVPDTDRAQDTEAISALFYEEASETIFLVWDSRVNNIHSVLNLASYGPEGWSEVIQVRGGWLTPRTAPRIAVTRDRHETSTGATSETVHRTYIHLLWWEGPDSGDEILYTPILLENGHRIENHAVIRLGDLISDSDEFQGPEISEALAQTPSLRLGPGGETLVVGFSDTLSGLMHFLEIRPASGNISSLAGGLGNHIIDIGYALSWQVNQLSFAAAVREDLHRLGENLHPGIRSFLAREVYQLLSSVSPEEISLEELAEQAQNLMIESSADLLSGRLTNLSGGLGNHIVDIGFRSEVEGPSGGYFLTSRRIRSLPAPVTPEAPTSLYLSATGSEAIVAWEQEGSLHYMETTAEGWTEPATLVPGPDLGLVTLHQVLRQRISNR